MLASWYQGRNRALDHDRERGDETSGMADHQLYNPWGENIKKHKHLL